MFKPFSFFPVFTIFIFASLSGFAQTVNTNSNSTSSYTVTKDSINGVKYISYNISITDGEKWITKQAECIFSKDSLMMFEKLYELHGTGKTGEKLIEKITMYGDLRNYKTLERIKGDKYKIKRYNNLGFLISEEKVLQSKLYDEWDRKIYTGKYAVERGK